MTSSFHLKCLLVFLCGLFFPWAISFAAQHEYENEYSYTKNVGKCVKNVTQRKTFKLHLYPQAPGTDHPALFSQTFNTDDIHWINKPPPMSATTDMSTSSDIDSSSHINTPGIYEGQFRFQHVHPLIGCSWSANESGGYKVTVDMPMRAITCGQYAVFYKNNECLGSGRIQTLGKTLYDLNVHERVVFPKQYS